MVTIRKPMTTGSRPLGTPKFLGIKQGKDDNEEEHGGCYLGRKMYEGVQLMFFPLAHLKMHPSC